jgi:carbonic anhydrase/acetyltransferase-like protein (isoleucine patch superfamily)
MRPNIDEAKFIALNSCIVGDVSVGELSSVWYGCVLRGDKGKIQIGKQTIIQDLTTLHPTNLSNILIGDHVYYSNYSLIIYALSIHFSTFITKLYFINTQLFF